jgi:arabinofuranosyltransferase
MHAEPPAVGDESRRASLLAGLLVAGAIAVFLVESVGRRAQIDDAYISFRYARNLVEGHGLVYNIGQRVEGFTNLLWVLLVALGMKLGGDAPALSHWLGVLSGVALLVLGYAYARCVLHPRSVVLAALSPWLVLACTTFALWTTSGLETPLFSALVLAALVAEARRRPTIAMVACVVATLTRPEGVLVAAVILGGEFVRGRRRNAVRLAAGYALFAAALTTFRLVYFGSPLPNTFYAKVGHVPVLWVLTYFEGFVIQVAAPLSFAAVLGARRSATAGVGVAYVAALSLYVLAVGGDAFGHSRFFLPALPVLVALALAGAQIYGSEDRWVARCAASSIPVAAGWYVWGAAGGLAALAVNVALASIPMSRRIRLTGATAIAVIAGLSAHAFITRPPLDASRRPSFARLALFNRAEELSEFRIVEEYFDQSVQLTAAILAERSPPPRRVAAAGIGVLGWYLRVEVVDLLGLVDPVIARSTPRNVGAYQFPGHQRGNADYVLSLAPDYILIAQKGFSFELPAVTELLNHPSFEAKYQWDPAIWGFRKRRPKSHRAHRPRP